MANMIDISKMITNELPVVKITDDIVVTVNNRKSTILNIQAMAIEVDKKRKKERIIHHVRQSLCRRHWVCW